MVDFESPSQSGGNEGSALLASRAKGKFTYLGILAYIEILVYYYIGNIGIYGYIGILVAKWSVLSHPVRPGETRIRHFRPRARR